MRFRVRLSRVRALVKAFLKSGIITEERLLEDTTAGTPQRGIRSPVLANVGLSVLDGHIAERSGGPNTGKLDQANRLLHGGMPTTGACWVTCCVA